MLWSKLKNVILAVLLLTNLFLLALVVSETVVGDSQELEARSTALLFLEERGLFLEESAVPKSFDLASIQVHWDRSGERGQAEALLGTVEEESLGGEIVRYFGAEGEIRFHGNGDFYGSFTDLIWEEGSQEEHGALVLEKLGLSALFLYEEEGNLFFVQTLETERLVGCEIALIYEGDRLVELRGKRIVGQMLLREEENLTVASALMRFYFGLGEEGCSAVFGIEPCYLVSTPLSSPAYLTASWRIETDVGIFYLNGVSGEVEYRGQA